MANEELTRVNSELVTRIQELEQKLQQVLALSGIGHCETHSKETHGARNCQVCACEKLSHALSKISYLCGPPNEMQMGDYDTHYNENEVVKQVKSVAALSQTCLSYFHAQSAYLHAMNTKQPNAAELCMKADALRDKALKMAERIGITPLT